MSNAECGMTNGKDSPCRRHSEWPPLIVECTASVEPRTEWRTDGRSAGIFLALIRFAMDDDWRVGLVWVRVTECYPAVRLIAKHSTHRAGHPPVAALTVTRLPVIVA